MANTPEFANAQRQRNKETKKQRNKVEALSAELKNQIGFRRLRLQIKVCSGAVLPGGGCAEHQPTGLLP
jgi:hypothetical protein